jgi:hypothetical protein
MLKKLITVLAAGFALRQWTASKQRHALTRKLDTSRRKPEDVSNWEGEGGALPVTGAQIGPEPAKS